MVILLPIAEDLVSSSGTRGIKSMVFPDKDVTLKTDYLGWMNVQ